MARRVYLHIGTMKSATSYLQSLFDANRDLLSEHGILWQTSRVNQTAVHDFRQSEMLLPHGEGTFKKFAREIREADGDVLVSMELLARWPSGQIRRFVRNLGPAEIRVIITARDLTRIAPSHWQETTQNRGITPWAEWVAQVCDSDPNESDLPFWRHHHLPTLVRKWSEVATPGQIYLVTIPQSGGDPSAVWRRFASVLGVPAENVTQPRFSNAAIGATSAELMRRLNVQLGDVSYTHYRWGFKAALGKQVLARRAGKEPRPVLTADQHERLRSLATEMLEQLPEDDINVVGDLNDLVPPPAPSSPAYDPAQATDAELLEAAVVGLAALGQRVSKLRIQRDELQRRLDGQPVQQPTPRRVVTVARRGARRRLGRLKRAVLARR